MCFGDASWLRWLWSVLWRRVELRVLSWLIPPRISHCRWLRCLIARVMLWACATQRAGQWRYPRRAIPSRYVTLDSKSRSCRMSVETPSTCRRALLRCRKWSCRHVIIRCSICLPTSGNTPRCQAIPTPSSSFGKDGGLYACAG